MFEIKAEAELRNINSRAQANGDEWVRALDLKLIAIDAPADKLDGAINGFLSIYYDAQGNTLGGETYPLKVRHKLDAATVTLKSGRNSVTFNDVILKAIHLTPKTGKRVDCTFTVQAIDYADGILDKLTRWQRETVDVQVQQRQIDAGMEQAAA